MTELVHPDPPRGLHRVEAQGRRIDHVGIVVEDVHEASRWWTGTLGLTLVHVADVLDGAIRLAYLELGGTTIQLVQPLRSAALRAWLDSRGEGLHHVCFLVDDLRLTLDALDDRGERAIYMGGRGASVCFIHETPCGVLVELTEATDPTWTPGGSQPVVVVEPEGARDSTRAQPSRPGADPTRA